MFAAFDILWLNGEDLRARPLTERKRDLTDALPATGERLLRVDAIEGDGQELFDLACAQDLEGVVGKWAAGTYTTDGRTTSWVKVKNPTYSQAEGRADLFEGKGRRGRRRPLTLVLK